jgi:hypothetical protein
VTLRRRKGAVPGSWDGAARGHTTGTDKLSSPKETGQTLTN